MDAARVEAILKESEALIEGHFILTSGRHSNQYMQCAKILQYPKFAEELAKGLASFYRDENIEAVIGPATGGIILAYETARHLGARNLFAEREEGKMVLRRGFSLPQGTRIMVVEDVITTGGTVQETIDLVLALGGNVVGAAVLVDRSMGVVDFGVPFNSLYKSKIMSWDKDDCPLCRDGALPAVKPGSRGIVR
ncbi:MAG: orotate phosphoribosyltransferase [Defluviitaleaceae bacterium]|nr:orotate phosphoribosyltransferase [Defluviitaleaceae bacterium]